MMKWEYRSCRFLFFNDSQVKLHYWQMHQEYVNPKIDQISEPYEPNITVTNRIVSDITHGKEVEVKHPEVQGSDAKSDLSVENHPGEPLEYHESSQESRTDQTREASVRLYSYSSMD